MSDTALRALERAAASGGDEARARLLTARVRAGSLTMDRVGLAAFAGNKSAQLACGCCCCPSIVNRRIDCWVHSADQFPPVCSVKWIHEVAVWGLDTVALVALVAAREALGDWPDIKPEPGDATGEMCLQEAQEELRVIEAGEKWFADRSEENHRVWWTASNVVLYRDAETPGAGWDHFARVCLIPEDAPFNTVRFIKWAVQNGHSTLERTIRDRVSSELIAWALRESHE
jgi:hypothetical protein